MKETAIYLLDNPLPLKTIADTNPVATIRMAALRGITDDVYLNERMEKDDSKAVRELALSFN